MTIALILSFLIVQLLIIVIVISLFFVRSVALYRLQIIGNEKLNKELDECSEKLRFNNIKIYNLESEKKQAYCNECTVIKLDGNVWLDVITRKLYCSESCYNKRNQTKAGDF